MLHVTCMDRFIKNQLHVTFMQKQYRPLSLEVGFIDKKLKKLADLEGRSMAAQIRWMTETRLKELQEVPA